MHTTRLLALTVAAIATSGCIIPIPVPIIPADRSNLSVSDKAKPDDSICPKGWKVEQVGPGAWECRPAQVPPAPRK